MTDEKISLEPTIEGFEEPVYTMPPQPEAHVVSSEETVAPGEPEVAEETLSDLIAAQVQNQMNGLRSELQAEIQAELKGRDLLVKG